MTKVDETSVLLIVDVQYDFCPGGALGVDEGDQVVEVINSIIPLFDGRVITSQDWHPNNHSSFKENGGIWPPHCVAFTHGAALRSDINLSTNLAHIYKGVDANKEAYSAFDGGIVGNVVSQNTTVADFLKQSNITMVYITGIATDYCVKATALDAVANGFTTYVVTDACRGVAEQTSAEAVAEMLAAGVKFVRSSDLT